MAFNLSRRPNVRIGIEIDSYCRASRTTGIALAVIRAVDEVESAGSGFLRSNGRPKILFEGHYFYKLIKGRHGLRVAEAIRKQFPTICYKEWTKAHYIGREGEYRRLAMATEACHKFGLSDDLALRSCSWGRYQIMGENYRKAGYATVEAFVEDMFQDEEFHLAAFLKFVDNAFLDDELRALPSDPLKYARLFAAGYNGAGYKRNAYDTKIVNSYRKFLKQNVDCTRLLDGTRHVVEVLPGERDMNPGAEGFANTSLDDRHTEPLAEESHSLGEGEGEPESVNNGSPSEPGVEKIEITKSTDPGAVSKIAIEKPKPVGFWSGLWQRIVAALGTNIGFETFTSNAQQVGALGLSAETWVKIGWFVLGATVLALLGYVYVHRKEKRREEELTMELMRINGVDARTVQLIDPELSQAYKERGYKVITR